MHGFPLKLALAALAASAFFSSIGLAKDVTAFVNVNVIPMDAKRVLTDQTVIVEDGFIVAIGNTDSIRRPRGAKVIKGEGRYLMPGLADMHAHIAGYAGDDAVGENIAVAENQLLLYAATGVTLLRDAAGSPAHFEHRRRLESGEWVGPDLYFTSPVLEGPNAVWEFAQKALDAEAVEPMIAQYAAEGYWGIKVYHTLEADVYDAVIMSAAKHGLPVIGHVPFEVGIDRALASGQYSIEHLRGYDFAGMAAEGLIKTGGRTPERFRSWLSMTDDRMTDLVTKTLAAGTWNCPTLAINRFLFDADARAALAQDARFANVHPNLRNAVTNANSLDAIFPPAAKAALQEALPRQQEFIRRLNAAGGKLLIGTDAVIPAYIPGFTPIDELALFIEAGVPVFDALKAATSDAAVSLGVGDRLGTVSVGKQANLILVDANPLEGIDALWRLSGVVLRGQWFDRSELEDRLEMMAASYESAND